MSIFQVLAPNRGAMSDQIEYQHQWRLVERVESICAFDNLRIIEATITEGMKCPITLGVMEGKSLTGGRLVLFLLRFSPSSIYPLFHRPGRHSVQAHIRVQDAEAACSQEARLPQMQDSHPKLDRGKWVKRLLDYSTSPLSTTPLDT